MEKPVINSFTALAPLIIQKYERYLPTAFDDSMTMLQKVNKVINQLNEIGEISNGVVEQWNNVTEWVMNGAISEDVNKRLDELVVDGTLADIINVSIFEDLNTDLTNTKSDVASHSEKISTLEQNNVVKKQDTFGTFETASVQSFIANMDDGRVEVLGITPEEDHRLAEYPDRDTVTLYRANSSRFPTVETNAVTYTAKSVVINDGTLLTNVKEGMIVDTKHTPKYSGFVESVAGNTLNIRNWYQMGNTAKGQIPPNTAGIKVNPITKVWVDNANVYLMSEHDVTSGVIGEYGVLNEKANGMDINGLDVVSLGNFKGNNAFIARSSKENNKFSVGFKDVNSDVALYSENSKDNELLLKNAVFGFTMRNDGMMNRIKTTLVNSNQTTTIDPNNNPVFLLTNTATHSIITPAQGYNCLLFVYNLNESAVTINGQFAGGLTSYSVPARTTKIITSDGGSWFVL